jgi:electron transfer flavoprotein beta subunit
MKAKTKPVQTVKLSEAKGDAAVKVVFSNFRSPPEKAPGKMLSGDAATQVKELVRLLHEEAKVI